MEGNEMTLENIEVSTEDIVEDAAENDVESVEDAAVSASETEPETGAEAGAPTETDSVETEGQSSEYDWETDINARVGNMETTLESIVEQMSNVINEVKSLTDERDKRNAKLSGFFKPMSNAPKDDTSPVTYEDLYTVTRK